MLAQFPKGILEGPGFLPFDFLVLVFTTFLTVTYLPGSTLPLCTIGREELNY